METEYLDWVGDKGNLAVQTLRCSGGAVRKLRATFDVRHRDDLSNWAYIGY